MNSVDTNVLIYAVNQGCVEHEKARAVYEIMLATPREWILSDQVLFEFYRGLRNPKILERPLTHQQSMKQVVFLREESGVLHCCYETSFWNQVTKKGANSNPKAIQVFDRVLAVTLLNHGVRNLYTRNEKDFELDQVHRVEFDGGPGCAKALEALEVGPVLHPTKPAPGGNRETKSRIFHTLPAPLSHPGG